jgi:hypothetical protein
MRQISLVLGIGLLCLAFWGVFGSRPAAAQTHEAHEHGVAVLNVAVEKGEVEIGLDSPLINFIPFEHAPGNPEEEQAVRQMGELFADFSSLFVFPAQAGCAPKGFRLESANIPTALLPAGTLPPGEGAHHEPGDHDDHDDDGDHEDHDHGDHDHGDAEDADHDHGDLEGLFVFACQKPETLKSLSVKLFEKFPSLETLNVQLVTDTGQKGQSLKADNPTVNW